MSAHDIQFLSIMGFVAITLFSMLYIARRQEARDMAAKKKAADAGADAGQQAVHPR